jgi:enoyl-CoA hydratase/carnithine racemase
MPSSGWERLRIGDSGSRVDITIDWPERRNALDFTTWDELERAMTQVQRRDEVRVVTLTGAGDAFCAGVSFDAIKDSLDVEKIQYPSFIRRWAAIADLFERVAQPTVAAINGAAIGAGFEIALACDIRVASDQAVFCMPQMRMGIVPDAGGTSRLARAAGEAVAKDLILTSRVIDAQEALRCGIVSRVVPADKLAAEVDDIAGVLEQLPWPAGYFAMVAIDSGTRLDPRRASDLEGIADQVMLREDEVWRRVDAFMAAKGLKGMNR